MFNMLSWLILYAFGLGSFYFIQSFLRIYNQYLRTSNFKPIPLNSTFFLFQFIWKSPSNFRRCPLLCQFIQIDVQGNRKRENESFEAIANRFGFCLASHVKIGITLFEMNEIHKNEVRLLAEWNTNVHGVFFCDSYFRGNDERLRFRM